MAGRALRAIAALVAGGSVLAGPSAVADTGVEEAARHPCAAATSRCDGEIEVPLDWANPRSERITVAFAWVPRKDGSRPAAGTILANPGGPLPALGAVPEFEEALGPVLDTHNLLVVEPRGLGAATPLRCPGLDLERPESVAACAEHLGPRRAFFTADQAAADMDAVRSALGVPKVTFHGVSYGTAFAQAYAARFPDRLSGMLLDSVLIPDSDGYLRTPLRSNADRLDVACAPSAACRRLPYRGAEAVDRLARRLRAHPDPRVRPVTLISLANGLAMPMAGRSVNAAVAAYLDGDPLPLRRLTSTWEALPTMPLRGAELAGLVAYNCGDSSFPFTRTAPPQQRRAELDRHYAQDRPYRPFTIADLGGSVFGMQEVCHTWPASRPSPPVPPGTRYPDVPVLVVAGDFDTPTTAEAAELARRFPRGALLRVRAGGHNLTTGPSVDACVRAATRAFLADPAGHRGTPGCDRSTYRAIGSFPRTLAQVPAAQVTGLPARDRRVLAAAFATVADAAAMRDPLQHPAWLTSQPGLRGGELTFDDEAAVIRLDQVRFVGDLAVSGEIRLGGASRTGGEAAARLTVTDRDGTREVRLAWRPFTATEHPAVSGSYAGRRFTGTIPLH